MKGKRSTVIRHTAKRASLAPAPMVSTYQTNEQILEGAIDFIHSLNIGGQNQFDWTMKAVPSSTVQVRIAPLVVVPIDPLGKACQVTGCRHNSDGRCTQSACAVPMLYQSQTGRCATCDTPLGAHLKCQGCNIFVGPGHWDALCEYRGHQLCGHCVVAWRHLETMRGRQITWQEWSSPERIKYILG